VSQAIPVLPTPAQPQVVLRDGHNIPLVQKLMAQGFKQLQLGQLDNAEETYVQVQRIAPQYSSVYARLSQVALKRKDGATAEVMARRGLVLTRSPQQKQGFWQLIALAGAMQNKSDVVNEANGHLRGQ
jgi:Tfp pilus assembly protein PilF